MESTLFKRMLAGYADHPAPEHCPDCGTKLISSLTYPFEGEIHESGYCVECGVQVPEPKGDWSKQNPTPEDFYGDPESVKGRRERMMGRSPWG